MRVRDAMSQVVRQHFALSPCCPSRHERGQDLPPRTPPGNNPNRVDRASTDDWEQHRLCVLLGLAMTPTTSVGVQPPVAPLARLNPQHPAGSVLSILS
jgi:hypothetical protein